jgi:hypothetical protein
MSEQYGATIANSYGRHVAHLTTTAMGPSQSSSPDNDSDGTIAIIIVRMTRGLFKCPRDIQKPVGHSDACEPPRRKKTSDAAKDRKDPHCPPRLDEPQQREPRRTACNLLNTTFERYFYNL